jgi:hypothetical protein
METNVLHSAGDYLSITLQGLAKVDATKLNFDLLDREGHSSTPPIYRWLLFFEIENNSSRTWEWKSHEWNLNDGAAMRSQSTELVFALDQLPGGWDVTQFEISPGATVKTIFVYEDFLDENADWVLSYRKMVAEGWYKSIKKDEDVHITDYTDQYEEIELVVPADDREKLRWQNYSE